MTRGRSRNAKISEITAQAENISRQGVKEVVLTGVNVGDFGKTTGETFYGLLKALVEIPGIQRYRISSIEPDLLSDEIIQFVRESEKLMPHFHIPLQSGSDRILQQMRRNYTTDYFAGRIEQVRKILPLAGIGIDVIVGFPGETEQDFQEMKGFLASLDFSYLHVFSYSDREYTRAQKMTPKIPPQTKEARSKELHELSDAKKHAFMQQHRQAPSAVLFENTVKDGKMFGFTENYIKVATDYHPDFPGTIRSGRLEDIIPPGMMTFQEF
jgi:threonylcarbamoyladenosine tRNA methylthiotransferase MtaB